MTMAPPSALVVEDFNQAVDESDGLVLTYCRCGTRSASLWALGEGLAGRMTTDDVGVFGAMRSGDGLSPICRRMFVAFSGPMIAA